MSLTDEPSAPTGPDPAEEETPEDLARRLGNYPGLKGLWWAMVLALRELDGKAHRSDLVEPIAAMLDLSDEERAEPLPSGTGNYFVFTLDRTAQDLKDRGIIRTPSRGQHADDLPPGYRELTPLGWRISEAELVDMSHKVTSQDEDPPLQDEDPLSDESLASMVERFRQETGYPTEAHKEQEHLRAEWAEKLSPENVARLSREDLTAYTNHAVNYGEHVRPVEGVMQWILDLDVSQYARLLDSIGDLCWGRDELSTRIDRLIDWGGSRRDTGTKGFAGGNVSNTLAICLPERFLPVFSQGGVWGRVHMLRRLGLPEPQGSTHGQQVVDANDRLREHLAPYFEKDTLGMAAFLYWLREQAPARNTPSAWMIRGGRRGEFEGMCIEEGLACVGWSARQLPDLTQVESREEIAELVQKDLPEWSDGQVKAWTGQLWRLKSEVRRGDIVVMPMKTSSQIALGVVSNEYWYREDVEPDAPPHVLSVDWMRADVPRSALKDDLLASLGSQLTICAVRATDAAWRLQQVIETGSDPGPREEYGGNEASGLSTLVKRFRDESGYPTEAHQEQRRLQMEWAAKLSPENIANLSRHELTGVASHGTWHAGTYVYPHVQGVMKWIRALDGDEYAGMLDHIRYLCWSGDEPWRRYDQLTDARSSRKTTGLGHSTTSRLLAITHPQDFLAIGVQGGEWGRAAMLRRLGLPKPAGSSYGQRVMDADRRLREHLEPHFGDDTLGMGAFVGWMLVQEPPVPGVTADSIDPSELEELADELLVDLEFLEDIVELLKDKGQVILYGPPGTGKTYLARELAKVLAPDDSCRALVQFHPSTSYEDFFEGYRPAKSEDGGGIRYELTLGPLARMAKQAFKARDRQHVMIIDEINRGNLPRVLGELLFLLEYRDERVNTLYRPEETFKLPKNLWFIGTMNTADRSIALVDAALRRRFHFVPFFPNRWPIADLLADWLERKNQPDWLGRLVDAVNDELEKELGGPHLLLGPSHFMKQYGSSPDEQRERLRRIWEYNIEPFIEDQFFGDPGRIEHYRFSKVFARHGPAAKSNGTGRDDGDDTETTDGSEGEHAAADGVATAEPGSMQPEDER